MLRQPQFLRTDPFPTGAPLRNREPGTAPATFTSLLDESVQIVAGSALDMRAMRPTATPAGSLGRITISGDKLHENGLPVRFYLCTIQPDMIFTPISSDRATVDAAVASLARRGFNAIRLMGLELWVMAGQTGVAVFESSLVDALDYFMAACKREGIYWVISIMGYNCFEDLQGAAQRFTYTEASNCKPRMYTEQTVRDNYALGITRLYNRVNAYTGINMLQDPALLMIEPFNEQSTTFCSSVQFPSRWLARTEGATAGAQTWGEWLADPTKGHGHADLAALNTSWGTAFASYALAAADANPAMDSTLAATQKSIDLVRYMQYLEDNLGAWYESFYRGLGYTGPLSWHTMYPAHLETRGVQTLSVNEIANWHSYTAIAVTMTAGAGSETKQADNPAWECERQVFLAPTCSGTKPTWMGEVGWPSFFKWRHQFPLTIAAMASQGASGSSWFTQGDFQYPRFDNDTSTHGDRIRILDTWATPIAHANVMADVMHAALLLRGDVSELSVTDTLGVNERAYGVNLDGSSPRTTGRVNRAFTTMFQPAALSAALMKLRMVWTTDNTVDDVATLNTVSWLTLLQDAQTAGAIAADHPSLVSATTNSGNITGVATTGTVGGLTATTAAPVLTLAGNTLVTGDKLFVTNMAGTGGTWPGTNNRNSICLVTKGTGDYVQVSASTRYGCGGLSLTGLSGANFTSGTWCEAANVLESGNRQWGMSRRLKRAFVSTSKTAFFTHTAATLPATVGQMIVTALTDDCSVGVVSLDGNSIATSSRLLILLVGQAQNTGMTTTQAADGKVTITATGTYPVQQIDATASLSLGVTLPQAWALYRLAFNGTRISRETPASADAGAGRLLLTLRTGTVQPTALWELVR